MSLPAQRQDFTLKYTLPPDHKTNTLTVRGVAGNLDVPVYVSSLNFWHVLGSDLLCGVSGGEEIGGGPPKLGIACFTILDADCLNEHQRKKLSFKFETEGISELDTNKELLQKLKNYIYNKSKPGRPTVAWAPFMENSNEGGLLFFIDTSNPDINQCCLSALVFGPNEVEDLKSHHKFPKRFRGLGTCTSDYV